MVSSNNSLDILQVNVRIATCHVRQVVGWFRRSGLKVSDSIRRAGDNLGISHDLAWRLYHGQKIWALTTDRLRNIEAQYVTAIDREIAEMEKQTQKLRVIKAELESALVRGNVCSESSSSIRSSSIVGAVGISLGAVAI